jgi:uncharacterized protein YndB with AHSA1/START domain
VGVSSTRIGCHVNAPRARVYRALVDANAIAKWKVPTGMTSHVHTFEGREGGTFRISLTYGAPTGAGKTTAHTDTYHGRFVKLVPNEQVVEVVEFETTEPALRGEMTITIALADADGGTDVLAVHEGLPPGVPSADNEARLAGGTREARSARRVEPGRARAQSSSGLWVKSSRSSGPSDSRSSQRPRAGCPRGQMMASMRVALGAFVVLTSVTCWMQPC